MRYIIDIDNTIFNTNGCDYEHSSPIQSRIDYFNKLYDEGNEIVYFTARGTKTGIDWSITTKNQFNKYGVKHTDLIFGKPYGDVYIDDKALNIKDLNI